MDVLTDHLHHLHSQIRLVPSGTSINQLINQYQLINRSNQSIDQSYNQSFNQSINQSITQSINQSIIHSFHQKDLKVGKSKNRNEVCHSETLFSTVQNYKKNTEFCNIYSI